MDDEQRENIEAILRAHRRRLAHAMEQAAIFGVYVPPHIKIDIEDAQREIIHLETELGVYASTTSWISIEETYRQAMKAFYKKEWKQAVDLLSQVAAVAPGHELVQEKLAEAQQQINFQAFYHIICHLREEGDWKSVRAALNDLTRKYRDFPDPEGLVGWVRAQEMHDTHFVVARNAFENEDWLTCMRELDIILNVLHDDAPAMKLKQDVLDVFQETMSRHDSVKSTADFGISNLTYILLGIDQMDIAQIVHHKEITDVYEFLKWARKQFQDLSSSDKKSTSEYIANITKYSQLASEVHLNIQRLTILVPGAVPMNPDKRSLS